jgi:hypothetical protein
MHALVLHIHLAHGSFMGIDYRTPVLVGLSEYPHHRIILRIGFRQIMGSCTGQFTTLTTHTPGGIIKDSIKLRRAFFFRKGIQLPACTQSYTSDAQCPEKISSVNSHLD